jgi:GrpB-like predicted nucleotidyltransferase (UPF0157 family)
MSEGSQPEFLQPPVRADGPIRLADPDPEWAAQYAWQRERIQSALGPRAVQVEHVGSTSVPGLAAKPVIDIVLVVANSADEAGYLPDLETAGYVLQFREPDWYEHRFLRDHNPEVQIHVFTLGSPEVERMLLFRDRLRCRSDPTSVSCINAPNVSWLPDGGITSRTTQMRSRPSSKKSSPEPELIRSSEPSAWPSPKCASCYQA